MACDPNKRKEDACEICFHAKQTRSQFPISKNNAVDAFDLIHCDIWGPYSILAMCSAHYFLGTVDNTNKATGEASKLLEGFFFFKCG